APPLNAVRLASKIEAGGQRVGLLGAASVLRPVGLGRVRGGACRRELSLGGEEQDVELQFEAAEEPLARDDVLRRKGEVRVQVVAGTGLRGGALRVRRLPAG